MLKIYERSRQQFKEGQKILYPKRNWLLYGIIGLAVYFLTK